MSMEVENTELDYLERVLCGVVSGSPWGVSLLDKLTDPQLFSRPAHQILWHTMRELHAQRLSLSRDVVIQQLQLTRQLAAVGGAVYVRELPAHHDFDECEAFAGQLLTHGALRLVQRTGQRLAGLGKAEYAQKGLDGALKELLAVQQKLVVSPNLLYGDVLDESLKLMEYASTQTGGLLGYDTGLRTLNDILGGFKGGRLYVLAARPGIGKSALMATFARSMAQDPRAIAGKKAAAIFSLEMKAPEFVSRDVAWATHIPGDQLEHGWLPSNVSRQQFNAVVKEALSQVNILFDDTLRRLEKIESKCRRLHAEGKLGMVLIDYLQLLEVEADTRTQEIGVISRALKALAQELDVPVMALSQVSRSVESATRKDKRPKLPDLRESGDIEQDADVVMFLYRPDYYKDKEPVTGRLITGIMEVDVAKHRGGKVDMVPCSCDMRCSLVWDRFTLPFDVATGRPLPLVDIMPRQASLELLVDEEPIPTYTGPRQINQRSLKETTVRFPN